MKSKTVSEPVKKAFYQAHEISYAEYQRNRKLQTKVEIQRELDHKKAVRMVYDYNRKNS